MVNKFKTATKRIAAIAASAAIVSSTAFAGGLNNYPNNFVKNGAFDGQVIVGANAKAIDTTSAQSVIDNLKSQFSGNTDKVIIKYKSAAAGGESVSIDQNSNTHLNFGEQFSNVSRTKYDKNQFSVLADQTFTNSADTEDYTQDITLGAGQGIFEHSLVSSLGESKASDHIYIKAKNLMTYNVKFPSGVNVGSAGSQTNINKDFQGKTLNLLGNDYVVSDLTYDSTNKQVTKIELIGGANKVSLGGGESTTVNVDGKQYNVKVINVDSSGNKALIDINGQTYTLNLYETTDLAGVSIAVTDLFGSTQTSNGYATLVIGGNKITIEKGAQVKINGKYVSDSTDFYVTGNIDSPENSSKLDGFSFTFKPKNDIILKAGDSITDPLFNTLSISYNGENSVKYSNVTLRANSERVSVEGNTVNGNPIGGPGTSSMNLAVYDGKWDASGPGATIYKLVGQDSSSFSGSTFTGDKLIDGQTTDKITENGTTDINSNTGFTWTTAAGSNSSRVNITGLTSHNNLIVGSTFVDNGVDYNVTALNEATAGTWTTGDNVTVTSLGVDASNSDNYGYRFLVGDKDNQYLWELTNYDSTRHEANFQNVFTGNTVSNLKLSTADSLKSLDGVTSSGSDPTVVEMTGFTKDFALANERMMDVSAVGGVNSAVSFTLDRGDLTLDNSAANGDGLENITVKFVDDKTNSKVDINLDTSNLSGNHILSPTKGSSDVDSTHDTKELVTDYGTKIKYDSRNQDWVTVSTPNKQVEANVNLTIGGTAAQIKTVTVSAANKDAKIKELTDAGNTIVSSDVVPATQVSFDIKGPVMDTDVANVQNAIVVGGPAVNAAARTLMGIKSYSIDKAGVKPGEAIAKYYADSNSVLVYGYSGADTQAIVEKLNAGTANIQ